MSSRKPAPPFVLSFSADSDDLVGARWWNEAFRARAMTLPRRQVGNWLMGGVFVAFTVGVVWVSYRGDDDESEEIERMVASLELQQREGWNAGDAGTTMRLAHVKASDVDGNRNWNEHLEGLAETLAPRDLKLRPYYVPTLFQCLAEPSSVALRVALRPIHTPSMQDAARKADALAHLAGQSEAPDDYAVILDLPGPEAVAASATLARVMAPVFLFDNWPHPAGVVPSHETLAATLYYLPAFRSADKTRPLAAPALFVLDSNRLEPYRDGAARFDNRYVARLPTPAALASFGVRRVLYVRPADAPAQELDDLNTTFVTYRKAGIEVKFLSLGEFIEPEEPQRRHHYYGSPLSHAHFWRGYGWSRTPALPAERPPPLTSPPRSLAYVPEARDTLFSRRGTGQSAAFGHTLVRSDARTGALRGLASGSPGSGRSGSFGRTSSWSGG